MLDAILGRLTFADDAVLETIFAPGRDGGEWAWQASGLIEWLGDEGMLPMAAGMASKYGTLPARLREMAREAQKT